MSGNSKSKDTVGFNRMLRDVLVASLNKGMFPIALVFIVFIIIFWRLPEQDLSKFVFGLLDRLEKGYITGWVLFGITVFAWFFNAKSMRKGHAKEIDRMANEKRELQTKLAGKKLPSSNGKKH